jgi:hypothetical protein
MEKTMLFLFRFGELKTELGVVFSYSGENPFVVIKVATD